ncbi:MerR family transcriptional regulator [Catenuloplanes japonicus]|uniref:MerR family transcriptional regulator n=1 Tax=Catenuloplanes japonicus TaxID=33876 RepID=UPI00069199F9|nr:MerR family transcriptional regulator [Catenuloplanes japonicus]
MGGDTFSSGEVSEITGMSAHALRYYEREGLFPGRVGRTGGRWRTYTRQDVEWLLGCARLRASGMPVADIRRYAELVAAGPGNEEARLELMRAHRRRVERQMAELRVSLDAIATKTETYEKAVADGAAATLWTGEEPLVCALAAPDTEALARLRRPMR